MIFRLSMGRGSAFLNIKFYSFTQIFIDKFIYSFIILLLFVPAASQDWGLGFGPVTVGQERAKRAPDLWMPPPNLKPQSWRAGNEVRKVIEAVVCAMLF